MQIVELAHGDREAAAQLWDAAGLTRPWNDPLADFDRALDGPTSTVLGIRDDDRLVATALVGFDGHRGWIYYVAVAVDRRGEGLGAAVMAAAEAWLHARDVPKVQLMVRSSNDGVADFYERLGYEDADVRVFGRWLGP